MKLVCPACGAEASVDAWEADAEARAALEVAAGLPRPVARWILPYLALFRPGRGAPACAPKSGRTRRSAPTLTWKTTRKLLEDLKALVEAEWISWKQNVPRPNKIEAWARAMDKVVGHPPGDLPLKSHGYLRSIAYGIADQMDAESERVLEEKRRSPYRTEGDDLPIVNRQSSIVNQMTQEEILRRNRERARQILEMIEGKRAAKIKPADSADVDR